MLLRSKAEASERCGTERAVEEGTAVTRAIVEERQRRLSRDPPASPSQPTGQASDLGPRSAPDLARTRTGTDRRGRDRSPARSARSYRSTTSAAARARLTELKAEEKLAELRRQELQIEAELIKKKLAADLAVIEDEERSMQGDDLAEHHRKVDEWLQTNHMARTPGNEKNIRFDVRDRSPTPVRQKSTSNIDALADAIEKLARPRMRCPDLHTFSGSPNEWLPFKAAFRDTTKTYKLTPAENIQRLRSCLKGEARELVAALLYTATDPETVMKTLEQCFGRPEVIIDRAIEDLKKLPKPGPSATELNSFAVKIQNVVCVISNIGNRGYLFNPTLTREALEKLSPHIRSRWCDYASEEDNTPDPEIVKLSRFLMREADRALRYSYAPLNSKKEYTPRQNFNAAIKKKTNAVFNVTEEKDELQCSLCEKSHKLTECPKYKAMSVEKRWEHVKNKKLCFKCIVKKHRRFTCKADTCGVNECTHHHHQSLHQEREQDDSKDTEAVMTVTTASNAKAVLLKMCPVTVVGPRGEIKTLALLDEGATVTLIDEDIARKIGASGPSLPLRMRGVNSTQNENKSKLVNVQLKNKDNELHPLRARTIKNLKLMRQSVPAKLLDEEHLRDLAKDEVCYDSAYPGILIGADHWEYIVSQELRVGKPNQPAASRTQLGWVIHGTVPRRVIGVQDSVLHIHTADDIERQNQQLQELVEKHFSIDAMGIFHKPREREGDLRAIKIIEQTIKKTKNGYEAGLPWKRDDVKLPQSYDMALRRLHNIEKKMDADPNFAEEYSRQIDNLLQKGYAQPCDGTEKSSSVCWYLPHFAVQNPNKPGKRRLVFDAAAKSHQTSLNDYLLEGPDLLMSLPGILFRFREEPIAITADVQEMFLQVKIRKEDQPAQQFLWRGNDREKPPQHFKMTSMIFGAASSPFMAHYVRDYNARVHAHTHPLACEAITKNHYMDDLAASYDDNVEARRAVEELRTVHAVAGFTLRGWNSNESSVLEDVPAELRATTLTNFDEKGSENKILGLNWNAERDELGFNTSMNRVPAEVRAQARAPTKREALSAVMSIYDPLGLLSHYTIRAKIILQNLWRLKLTWDEPIPEEDYKLFAAWLEQLNDLASLRLERHYAIKNHTDLELHVLCDASEQAYAAVAYWQSTQPDGSFNVRLVAAKSKVAPKRTQTIPRLELQAAVIGARLANTIRKEHRFEVKRTIYWSDSKTVIQWIRNDARRYTPYVAHRLGEIAELTQKNEWRWIPTGENTADDATRLTDTPITAEDRWFRGPDFLHYPEDQWPTEAFESDSEEKILLHTHEECDQDGKMDTWIPNPSRFSKFETLVRATARVLLFIDKCRRRATSMERRHIEQAERALIRHAQQESFADELQRMKTSRPITKSSRLFRLDPVMEEGILRVRGRIGAANAPIEMKRPVILDGRHHIARLIVLREHCAAGHANRERVTNDLRQRYWVIHLRPTVRRIERECALCQVRKMKPQPPAMGDLPRARLEPFRRPFSNCGTDYFGPMIVKIGRRREKRWGALYTCLTTRAVHIELVPTLSISSAIMALRRMAARRGWPFLMMSDNATNFRGADKELRAAYAEWASELKDEGLRHRMEWRFIPPGAPNQGGAWERLVRSIKVALAATLREREPTEEVLHTLLTEAEYSVNARPLTHVSVDPDEPEALTPNHFLLGSSNGLPATGPCNEMDRRAWRTSQALADHFWQRWIREYLPTLVPRGEPASNRRPLRVGDIVVIVDHTLPRNVWPKGVVERTYEGPDGGIRVADVRTKSGIFKRPTSKIVVLVKEEATRAAPGGGCPGHDVTH